MIFDWRHESNQFENLENGFENLYDGISPSYKNQKPLPWQGSS
jgi:hypothetical protein